MNCVFAFWGGKEREISGIGGGGEKKVHFVFETWPGLRGGKRGGRNFHCLPRGEK